MGQRLLGGACSTGRDYRPMKPQPSGQGLQEHLMRCFKSQSRGLHPRAAGWLERGMVDMAIVTNPEAGRALTLPPLLGEPFALVSHVSLRLGPVVSVSQLARIPLLMTSLHRSIVERQLLPLRAHLNIQAEIDSVDSIRELVLKGQWATIMPVSVFKEPRAAEQQRTARGARNDRIRIYPSHAAWGVQFRSRHNMCRFTLLISQYVLRHWREPSSCVAPTAIAAWSCPGSRPRRAIFEQQTGRRG